MLFDCDKGDIGHVYDACCKDINHPYYPRRGSTETGVVYVFTKDNNRVFVQNSLGEALETEIQFHAPLTYVPWTQEIADTGWPEVATKEWLEKHRCKSPSFADIDLLDVDNEVQPDAIR